MSLLLIQERTASLSLQRCFELTVIVSCLETNCISLHPSTAACTSSFGVLISLSGATLSLAMTNSVEMVLADGDLMYMTAAYASCEHHRSNVTGLLEMARSEKQNIVALIFLAHLDIAISKFLLTSVSHLTEDHPMQVLLSKYPARLF